MIEHIIAYHCGPALAGIKPANIVSCHKEKIPDLHREIERLNSQLNGKDIYLEILCECGKRALVMVYKSKILSAHLRDNEMKKLLKSFGYPENSSLKIQLEQLKKRLKRENFPHEIGVFLGYPIHDIRGFIDHKDEGCLLTGEWKVYQNPEKAKALFRRYHMCRRAIVKRLAEGKTLAQVFCAVS
ncbi:DUF3793 family protein [Acetivibrio sp. MSJd-27]|jgi:hypothetical protein|uniref:DUF3793 family protein n=1 Tax=Acetivibrio sp. MSJd-27 TaxID=2841523 RepID=UPI0015B120E0|nr:DUF3793 family protein [Acetivibrio sp. MSJd-27]MBU5451273.1 DUF3793 family protein [Acetivibrio sp. MSJd-27]